jgi:hypothetical protein
MTEGFATDRRISLLETMSGYQTLFDHALKSRVANGKK